MTSTPTNTPPQEEESLFAHIGRVCKNATTKCFGIVQTSDEYAKIKYKNYQIDARKKAFGVAYLKLVEEKADTDALKACLDKALADIAVLEGEIEVLQAEIDRVNHTTKSKIVTKPGAATTPTAAAAAATPATTEAAATTVTQPAVVAAPAEAPKPKEETTSPDEIDMQEVALDGTPTATTTAVEETK